MDSYISKWNPMLSSLPVFVHFLLLPPPPFLKPIQIFVRAPP
jgi:hypothetical protein